jgi:PAS domain S-box-containing protein
MESLQLLTDAKLILDVSGGAAGLFDEKGRLVLANELLEEITGKANREFQADSLEFRHANFGKLLLWSEMLEMLSEKPFNMYVRIAQTPGRTYRCRLCRAENTYYVLTLTDVTSQAELEARFAQRASILDRVISDFPHMIAAMDRDGLIRIWNHRCEVLTGYSADDAVGNPSFLNKLIPDPLALKEVLEKWNTREENTIRNWEMEITCADGSTKLISWSVRYRENPIIPDLFTWAIGVDVTREKVAEQALKASEQRFQFISQATNDAVYDWDLEKNVLWWGDGMTKLFGHSSREIENNIEWWVNNLHPAYKDKVYNGVEAAIDSQRDFWTDEYLFRKRDGEYAFVLDRGFFIRNEDGRAVRMIGGMIDQSTEKALEKLTEEKDELIKRELERMAARYKSPLGRIVQISRLLSSMTADRKDIKELVDQLLLSSHQLSNTLASEADDAD